MLAQIEKYDSAPNSAKYSNWRRSVDGWKFCVGRSLDPTYPQTRFVNYLNSVTGDYMVVVEKYSSGLLVNRGNLINTRKFVYEAAKKVNIAFDCCCDEEELIKCANHELDHFLRDPVGKGRLAGQNVDYFFSNGKKMIGWRMIYIPWGNRTANQMKNMCDVDDNNKSPGDKYLFSCFSEMDGDTIIGNNSDRYNPEWYKAIATFEVDEKF